MDKTEMIKHLSSKIEVQYNKYQNYYIASVKSISGKTYGETESIAVSKMVELIELWMDLSYRKPENQHQENDFKSDLYSYKSN